jgi:ABC-type uncharacterized transport system involved in gliding motility auxiliary subunit
MANMQARQTRYSIYLVTYLIVILAVIGAVNWLAKTYNKSVDTTTNKRYTLSDQTEKVVKNLKKPINVYYFDKSDSYDRARDTFDRYSNLSSNFKVNYVDPDKKPDIARVEGMQAFGDIVLDSGEKKEKAKALTEEELTGALIRVLKSGTHMACFVGGEGEHTIDDPGREGYSLFKDQLEKNNYKTQKISLIEKPEVPATCNIVIVGGPKRDMLQPAVDALKKFVDGGGRLLLMFDPVLNLPDQKMGDTPALAALAAGWGVTANGDIILDLGAASRLFGATSPVVGSYESHPITRVMGDNATVFPLSRSLTVKTPAEKLFSSTVDSYALTNPKMPLRQEDVEKGAKGPFVIGAAASIGSGDKAGRVVIVGSSNFASNFILGAPIANRDLVLNMMNWLSSDEDLISIRPKEPEDRRLTITGGGLRVLFLSSIIIMPLLVIGAGFSAWWKRR